MFLDDHVVKSGIMYVWYICIYTTLNPRMLYVVEGWDRLQEGAKIDFTFGVFKIFFPCNVTTDSFKT